MPVTGVQGTTDSEHPFLGLWETRNFSDSKILSCPGFANFDWGGEISVQRVPAGFRSSGIGRISVFVLRCAHWVADPSWHHAGAHVDEARNLLDH